MVDLRDVVIVRDKRQLLLKGADDEIKFIRSDRFHGRFAQGEAQEPFCGRFPNRYFQAPPQVPHEESPLVVRVNASPIVWSCHRPERFLAGGSGANWC